MTNDWLLRNAKIIVKLKCVKHSLYIAGHHSLLPVKFLKRQVWMRWVVLLTMAPLNTVKSNRPAERDQSHTCVSFQQLKMPSSIGNEVSKNLHNIYSSSWYDNQWIQITSISIVKKCEYEI